MNLRSAWLLFVALGVGTSSIAQSVARTQVSFHPLTVEDVRRLPSSVAPEFRDPANYKTVPEGLRAPGNNCASFALNSWQKLSYSGGNELLDSQSFVWPTQAASCENLISLFKRNARFTTREAVRDRCPEPSYLVLPFVGRFFSQHLIRQLPDGRFIHIDGKDSADDPAIIQWIMVNAGSQLRHATSVRELDPFIGGLRSCPAVCITPQASQEAANSVLGTYACNTNFLYESVTLRSNGILVVRFMGTDVAGSWRSDGDVIATVLPQNMGAGLAFRLSGSTISANVGALGQVVCARQ